MENIVCSARLWWRLFGWKVYLLVHVRCPFNLAQAALMLMLVLRGWHLAEPLNLKAKKKKEKQARHLQLLRPRFLKKLNQCAPMCTTVSIYVPLSFM